jgi:hypothetical protein
MQCRPVGLGMPSTVKTLGSTVLPTNSPIKGSRRRGHKKAPQNLSFARHLPTNQNYHTRDAQQALEHLRAFHVKLLTQQGDTRRLEHVYEECRRNFRQDFPELSLKLARLEQEHERSLIPQK